MYFRKITSKIKYIKECMYIKALTLNGWETWEGIYEAPGKYSIDESGRKIMNLGDHWSAREDTTRWFSRRIDIPEDFNGEKTILDLDIGGESLVYIDGKVQSGLASFFNIAPHYSRSRVLVSQAAEGGSSIDVMIEAGLNYHDSLYNTPDEREAVRHMCILSMDYKLNRALLAVVDQKVEKYYFDLAVAFNSMQKIGKRETIEPAGIDGDLVNQMRPKKCDGSIYYKISDAIESSLAAADLTCGRESLLPTIDEAQSILWDKLNAIKWESEATVILSGHSHIDTAWMWPVKETIRKCARTFSNVISLTREYPENYFVQSQPQLYEYVKKYYPDIYSKIKEQVKDGHWEPVGNMWVEADTNVTSGESMVRQILYGRQFFEKEFGTWSRIYWMPDVFGYSWALPQIIKRSGMEFFYTAKLIANKTNRFPYGMFWWQGIDGTRILSYMQQVQYNGDMSPEYIYDAWDNFEEKDHVNVVLGQYGNGDGGGGPSYEMLEYGRRLGNFPGLPKMRIDSPNAFFNNAAENGNGYSVWNGEMYFENHRGTYTSQARNKRFNRKSELLYRQAEMASSLAGMFGHEYPKEKLAYGWKKILMNQFHDIIPGSSIHRVYMDSDRDYREVLDIGLEVENAAVKSIMNNIALQGNGIPAAVFNFLGWERTDTVSVEISSDAAELSVIDPSGHCVPCSTRKSGHNHVMVSFEVRNIPSMGYAVYYIVEEAHNMQDTVAVSANCLENRFFSIKLDDKANFISLYDKRNNCDVLINGGRGNILQIFEDSPDNESAWNIELDYQKKMWEVNTVKSVEVTECSPVRGVLRTTRTFNKSEIIQDIIIYGSIPRIDFETRVKWYESEKMLKSAFEVNILSPKATYEIAFGSIERPTHWNTSWDKAKFEVSAHKWADLAEGGYGVSLLNDCKYGYDIKDNVMRITLLRSPIFPDPEADKGEHEFIYSLYPHAGDWKQADTVLAGYSLNVPLKAYVFQDCRQDGLMPEVNSFISIDCNNVIIDTLKQAEDGKGLILRVYESKGIRGNAEVKLSMGFNSVMECNLMEENEKSIDVCDGSFNFYIKPFEIKSFRII